MSGKKQKLNIFDILQQIDRGDLHIWENLTEEQRKEFSPFMTMRWMSCTDDVRQIFFLNELINPIVFNMHKHPQLMLKLLTACSSKIQQRYKWIKAPVAVGGVKSRPLQVVKEYYGYPSRQAKDVMTLFSKDDILTMATELGYQKEDMKLLKTELKGKK